MAIAKEEWKLLLDVCHILERRLNDLDRRLTDLERYKPALQASHASDVSPVPVRQFDKDGMLTDLHPDARMNTKVSDGLGVTLSKNLSNVGPCERMPGDAL